MINYAELLNPMIHFWSIMPRGRIHFSIFLMLVLVLGFVSYPSSFPSIGLVFADDECDDFKGKEKADCMKQKKVDDDDKGKSDKKNDKAVKESDRDDDDDDDDDKGKSDKKNDKAVKESDRDDDDDDRDFTREDEDDDDRKKTICHFPPGNPLNAHTISVGSKAAQTHILKHDDLMGECEGGGPGRGDISIHGVKFFDENKDGERNGEDGLEGWEVVLKLSSKTVDTAFTNSDGEYWFEGLKEGTYEVGEVQKPGYLQTTPQNPDTFIILLSSDSKIRGGFDFGNSLEIMLESNEVFQNLSPNRVSSIESADDIISQLMQQIEELENRLQTLLLKLESGNYYGNTNDVDSIIRSFGISFDGSSTSKTDSTQSDVSGEVFLESLVTKDNSDKFRVIGGTISIGDTTHDIIFGKARSSSSGPSGEKDSMVLIAQLIDEEGNDHTIKLILDFEKSLEGNFGIEPMNFEIKPQSAVSNDWSISATGQLTVL